MCLKIKQMVINIFNINFGNEVKQLDLKIFWFTVFCVFLGYHKLVES